MKTIKSSFIIILVLILLSACLFVSCDDAITEEKTPETEIGLYDEYVLTEEDLAQINEAHFLKGIADYMDELSDEEIEQRRNSKYSKFAQTVEAAMARNTDGDFYFGKYGECFIFGINPMTCDLGIKGYTLGENQIRTRVNLLAVYEYEWIYVTEAYKRGLLSDADVDKLCEVFAEYYDDGIRYDYVPLQKTYVDYSEITPEFIEEINAAWLSQSGYEDPLLTDLDGLMYGPGGGEMYLGKYNGYHVFYFNDGRTIEGGRTYYVANHGFYVTGRLAAYRDGVIYDLNNLYERGEISYVDVSKMHDKYLEIYWLSDATNYLSTNDLDIPRVEKLYLDEKAEERITNALSPHLVPGQKAYITEYYGEYNGAYVFKYKTPSEKYEISGLYYEKVGNRWFIYRYDKWTADDYAGPRLLVYYRDEVYTLPEAYKRGFLSDSDIVTINAHHKNYYPYADANLIYNAPPHYVEELK